eukprot:GEZU01022329.1.p1 GENE.GEZU01022329.1~~GEZU01022329.1.p1  ORF type:complete len:235 (-),score=20.67 GEZU01022329.1:338-1042(-)
MPVSSDKFGTYEIVVLDIEGTTTPITFVHDVLFPYARSEVRRYLEENWTTAKCQEAVRMLVQQAELDQQQGENSPRIISISDAKNSNKSAIIDSIVQNVYYNMEKDRKIPALKNLQGLIWEFGYKNSQLKGEVYDDVPVAFEVSNSSTSSCSCSSSSSSSCQSSIHHMMHNQTISSCACVGMEEARCAHLHLLERVGSGAEAPLREHKPWQSPHLYPWPLRHGTSRTQGRSQVL